MGSKLTRVRRIRFPVELIEVIDRRVGKYPGEMNFNAYVVMQLRYMLLRKHIKTRGISEVRKLAGLPSSLD